MSGIIALLGLLGPASLHSASAAETRLSELISTVANSCDVATFNHWVGQGLDPDTPANGRTLLNAALTCGAVNLHREDDAAKCDDITRLRGEMVRAIVRAGADPNRPNDIGYTPPMVALLYDCTENAITELVTARADPMISEPDHHTTALDIALEDTVQPAYLAALLGDVEENAPLTTEGLPPLLYLALQYNACGEDRGYNVEKFELLLRASADRSIKTPAGFRFFSNISYADLSLPDVLKRRTEQKDPAYGRILGCLSDMLAHLEHQ